jgi:hypothetical protein
LVKQLTRASKQVSALCCGPLELIFHQLDVSELRLPTNEDSVYLDTAWPQRAAQFYNSAAHPSGVEDPDVVAQLEQRDRFVLILTPLDLRMWPLLIFPDDADRRMIRVLKATVRRALRAKRDTRRERRRRPFAVRDALFASSRDRTSALELLCGRERLDCR